MKCRHVLSLALIVFVVACKKTNNIGNNELIAAGKPITTSTSFFPLQIGNYWYIDANDYTEIQDTLRIQGKLYYKFYSLVGGDAGSTNYLRLDENLQVVEAYPAYPNFYYIHAKFNANVNDTFYPIGNGSVNDHLMKVAYKSGYKMVFLVDVYNNNFASAQSFSDTYLKGIGLDDKYTRIKIDGIVYSYK